MANNEEIKPIEEITNGSTENTTEQKKPPTPLEPPSAPAPPKPPEAPPAPPSVGKKAVIRRPRSPLLNIVLSAIGILAALGVVFYLFFYRVTFEINPSPRPDKVILDGKEINPGVYKAMPGTHTIIVEKQGYISYAVSRKFRIAERVKLNFNFEKEKTPSFSVQGARYPIISSNGELLYYLDQNSALSVLSLKGEQTNPTRLTNGQYPTARIIKVSKDNKFALIFDNEAIKIVDFSKPDLVNQVEAKLPPLASSIHSVSWNNNESSYFTEANSTIIYDLQSSYGWDVYLANRAHTQANMIMQFDQGFTNPSFDWGEASEKVLIAGGQLGVLNLPLREYRKVESDKSFVKAFWGPGAQYAVAVDRDGKVYKLTESMTLEELPLTLTNGLIAFSDPSTIAAVSDGKPVKYNLETKSLDYFAEAQGLKAANYFAASGDRFYYSNSSGLFSADFAKQSYK